MTMALLAFAAATMVSGATYLLARTYLVDQREKLATRQAFLNARLAKSLLRSDDPAPDQVVASVAGEAGTQVLVNFGGRWYTSAVSLDPAELPPSLIEATQEGSVAAQRFSRRGVTTLAIGIPIPSASASYYEVTPLRELQRTLTILATSLVVASAVTTIAGAGVGLYVSRRLLRPLQRMSTVAVDIAEGNLAGRLDAEGDADLEPLVHSFNHMVDALQDRINREARFASDVSHELRTPLTALATAVEIVKARTDDLPPRAATAVEVLGAQVSYFERLVLDLLEIARLDAGAEHLNLEFVDLVEFLTGLSRSIGGPGLDVETTGPWEVQVDKRRLERVMSNLIENADRYAGGATRIGLARTGRRLSITVDDHGPGIPPEELDHIFDRFWRGVYARQHTSRGSGLGLSLVAEHISLLGGSIIVASAPGGGARFVIELPLTTQSP
jgi:two-component system, OmpR family, sensor histidine kinase MtrB